MKKHHQEQTPPQTPLIINLVALTLFVILAVFFFIKSGPTELAQESTEVPTHTGATETEIKEPSFFENLLHPKPKVFQYIEIIDSCGPNFEGPCVNVRSGPGEEFPVVLKLRTGAVLKVAETVPDQNGRMWHKIMFDDGIRYRERVSSEWYIAADLVNLFTNEGDRSLQKDEAASSTKRIIVDRSEQMLYAYDGDILFMQEPISTGLEFTPTPRGSFTIYKMTPSRYMQGPLPGISDQYYDLPGVPWDLYFSKEGAVIHGAYWHDNFGKPWSHGCVNLPPEKARELYIWATLGTSVVVRD